MPNQRSQTKVFLGGYVDKALKRQLIGMARDAGMDHNRFGFIMELISDPLKQRRKKLKRSAAAKPVKRLARP